MSSFLLISSSIILLGYARLLQIVEKRTVSVVRELDYWHVPEWGMCPTGWAMTGMYRGGGSQLHRLEYIQCSRIAEINGWKNCAPRDIAVSGWFECPSNKFAVGLRRRGNVAQSSSQDNIYNLMIMCCELNHPTSDIVYGNRFTDDWWACFDRNNNWCNFNAHPHYLMTGILRNYNRNCQGLWCIEEGRGAQVNANARPTKRPTSNPTKRPTSDPTSDPTKRPSMPPTKTPTGSPTLTPSASPTIWNNNIDEQCVSLENDDRCQDDEMPCKSENEYVTNCVAKTVYQGGNTGCPAGTYYCPVSTNIQYGCGIRDCTRGSCVTEDGTCFMNVFPTLGCSMSAAGSTLCDKGSWPPN